MSKQAAAALFVAGFVAAAALPLRADEAANPQPASALAAASEAVGDTSPDAHRSVPELSAELIFAIALLVTSVASIPGRIR
jgi:hypothetical protein